MPAWGLYERSNLELQLMLHRKEMPSEALFGMASNYMALGDYDQAENLYRTYEKVEPDGEFVPQADDALTYIAQCDYDTPLDRELDELSMDGKAALDAGDIGHAIDCLQRRWRKIPPCSMSATIWRWPIIAWATWTRRGSNWIRCWIPIRWTFTGGVTSPCSCWRTAKGGSRAGCAQAAAGAD